MFLRPGALQGTLKRNGREVKPTNVSLANLLLELSFNGDSVRMDPVNRAPGPRGRPPEAGGGEGWRGAGRAGGRRTRAEGVTRGATRAAPCRTAEGPGPFRPN